MTRHANIPIFIPHLGCPNQCVFCNQRTITGVSELDGEKINSMIEEALSTIEEGTSCEIAFFGGSFTGIDYDYMCELLEVAYSYVRAGRVKSIRCSTRPDYINKNILDTLWRYGVRVIELGLQSASERVLLASRRGHTRVDEQKAAKMIVDYGFTLVAQMMIGLPESTPELEEETARFICEIGAAMARIYPTIVFRDTELCDMAIAGEYTPLSLDEAIVRSANVYKILKENGVEVIRIGLCDSENLRREETYFAGPNHPSLGELVIGEYFYKLINEKISQYPKEEKGIAYIYVARGYLSSAIGQKKKNKLRLMEQYPHLEFVFREDSEVGKLMCKIEFEERKEKCI